MKVSVAGSSAQCGWRAGSSTSIPVQHAQCAQCVPAAGLADACFHLEVDPIRVNAIERPSPVLVTSLLHQLDRLGEALVGFGTGAPQVVEPPQHVIVPGGRKREARPAAINDLAG